MVKLKDVVGKLWRKSPEDLKHMTIYGHQELTKFICRVCKKEGILSETYLKSLRDRKHANDFRPYHANCYTQTNGKYLPQKEKSTASLFEFFES
jgi:hypothetical protein